MTCFEDCRTYQFSSQHRMSLHIRPPFRAEQIGSLKRPAELLNARAAFDENEISAEELKAVEDVAIADNVELQISSNIGSITDGEFRRYCLVIV
jgi:methionine synthase II (cobalamin-independent)